jgi:hypothetical protein
MKDVAAVQAMPPPGEDTAHAGPPAAASQEGEELGARSTSETARPTMQLERLRAKNRRAQAKYRSQLKVGARVRVFFAKAGLMIRPPSRDALSSFRRAASGPSATVTLESCPCTLRGPSLCTDTFWCDCRRGATRRWWRLRTYSSKPRVPERP